jgi:hypothetical protein
MNEPHARKPRFWHKWTPGGRARIAQEEALLLRQQRVDTAKRIDDIDQRIHALRNREQVMDRLREEIQDHQRAIEHTEESLRIHGFHSTRMPPERLRGLIESKRTLIAYIREFTAATGPIEIAKLEQERGAHLQTLPEELQAAHRANLEKAGGRQPSPLQLDAERFHQ